MTDVTLVGRLGGDPEVRFTAQGKAVANFSLAVTERRYNNGQWEDGDTSWYRVAAWDRLGENAAESLSKGDLAIVVGKVKVREYEHDGQKRTSVDVTADHLGPSIRFATARPQADNFKKGPSAPVADGDPSDIPF